MTILKSFHRMAYQILPTFIIEDFKNQKEYQAERFFCDIEIFSEFFKVAVERGSTVLDCGLNLGMHTDILLSLGVKKVIAFEASREILEKVVPKYQDNDSVTVVEKALSNEAGKVVFYECDAMLGSSSLRRTRDIRKWGCHEYEVEATRLDDEPIIREAENISCVKVDLEGADILALDGGRKLLEKHAPYVIMEYVDTLTEYYLDGKKLDKYSILNFCKEIDYIPFNLYGICILDEEIFEESVFEDMNDLILVPKSKLHDWTTLLLPRYQYAIFEKLLERIELYDKFPGNLSIMSMCKRIYREVNIKSKPDALAFLVVVRDNLVRILQSPAEIDDNPDIKARGALVLKLIYFGGLEDAYNLALKREVTEQALQKYEAILAKLSNQRAKRDYVGKL